MSVIELSKGNFKVRYRVGKRQFAKSGFTSKREAKAYEAEQLRRIRGGLWTDPAAAKATVGAVFADWIDAKSASARTVSDYRELWKSCVAPTWEHVRLQDVTPASITRWVSGLTDTYSASRARKALTVFSQVMDWAVADERLAMNPVGRAKSLARGPLVAKRDQKAPKRFLTHAEVADLAGQTGPYRLMILVMAYTGVRFGEVTALQMRDVDLLRNRLIVQRAYADVRGALSLVTPKSGKAREIPLPALLREPLAGLLADASTPDALLFTAQEGGPVRYSRWRQDYFNPAVKAAQLSGLTPHGLRHTYAALAVQAGANPKVLQAAMGHSDIRLTLDTYGGLFGTDLDALASGLDSAVEAGALSANVPNVFPLGTASAVGG